MKIQSQRGVALVITLIMLSVITFLTVAFLALSRREKASMSTTANQTASKLALGAAIARAQSDIAAHIMATTNLYGDLLVTRSYVTSQGFDPGSTNLANVNYEHRTDGSPLSPGDQLRNITNLFYDARVPVFVPTNELGSNDFRFYYDLNRNRRYDTNGFLPVIVDESGNTNGTTNFFLGDPEWIGVAEKPEYPHSGTNRYLARYAYVVLPEGKSLDLNYIHNHVKQVSAASDGFLRNQGVGSWEINLAGFLAGLNTNYYGLLTNGYTYNAYAPLTPNQGAAFEDAIDLLNYRYGSSFANLPSAAQTLGPAATVQFPSDMIDLNSDGPLVTNYTAAATNDFDVATVPWPGSRNTNRYFDVYDLLNTNKIPASVVNRLQDMGNRTNSYDRYAFSRLLSQLGTYSSPESGKLHLNYDNVTTNNGVAHQTNFIPWTPIGFFTNAAERLIQRSIERRSPTQHFLGGIPVATNFSITNIQIYPTNEYTPTVHQLLQVAANIYAASTNGFRTNVSGRVIDFPNIFRPKFAEVPLNGTNVFVISGYEEVTTDWGDYVTNQNAYVDIKQASGQNAIRASGDRIVYGVPWVVSAKKGFPSFNEFSLETVLQVTRRLQLRKTSINATNSMETNQMYTISVTNRVGTEFWNSYTNAFPMQLSVLVDNKYVGALTNEISTVLTNSAGYPNYTNLSGGGRMTNYLVAGASYKGILQTNSFVVVSNWVPFLPESQYINHGGSRPFFKLVNANTSKSFERNKGFYIPDWDLVLTNRVICAVAAGGRLIDFVNLDGIVTSIDVTTALYGGTLSNPRENRVINVWRTNRVGGSGISAPTEGIINQLQISLGNQSVDQATWSDYSPLTGSVPKDQQIAAFRKFVGQTPFPPYQNMQMPTNLTWEAPFTPTRRFYQKVSFQANDPLVHHMAGDLIDPRDAIEDRVLVPTEPLPTGNLAQINKRYNPWGGNRIPGAAPGSGDFQFDPTVKDPLIRWSDDWDFPTNKFPNIGWLGRVHRGTPWQTVYLKSGVAPTGTADGSWFKWSGSEYTHPTNDWFLMDLFTMAPNDNATRGLLSINQAGEAAWSAVLSGVITLSNSFSSGSDMALPEFEPLIIQPGTTQLVAIVNGINAVRGDTNLHPTRTYSSLGHLLAVPQLTMESPYLNRTTSHLPDAAWERIPQQIMSLLKLGEPRFVVYAFGQSLKPAPNSIVFDPPYQNLCTNYQITGEMAARAVLRVEGTPDKPKIVVESYNILPEE